VVVSISGKGCQLIGSDNTARLIGIAVASITVLRGGWVGHSWASSVDTPNAEPEIVGHKQ
jgi:hypothetical protein